MLSTRHASRPTPPARGPLAALARWDAARATRAALVLTALVYLLILVPPLALAGFNPLVFAHVGREGPGQRFWDQSPPLVDGYGYDGQFYYYLARDPLLRGGPPTYLDAPGYRYQRILLPALAALLALGQPGWIGWTLLLANLLGLALGCWAAVRIVEQLGACRWWLLAFALNPGFLLGISLDVAEPVALGLCTAATLAYLKGRHWPAALLIALGQLARESVVLVALGFGAYELLARRSPRRAAPYLLPLGLAVAWELAVRAITGELPIASGTGRLGPPFGGVGFVLGLLARTLASALVPFATKILAATFGLVVVLVLVVAVAALAGVRHRSAFGWQLALQGLFLITLTPDVWGDRFLPVARVAMLLVLFYVVVALEARRAARPAAAPTVAARGPTARHEPRG